MATPRRALGDVKNNFGSAAKLLNFKELNTNKESAYKGSVIDFTEISDEFVKPMIKSPIANKVEHSPTEKCSCTHDHRNEKYTLIDDTTEFVPLEADTYKMDEWSTYYTDTENNITSWRQFLEDNDLL